MIMEFIIPLLSISVWEVVALVMICSLTKRIKRLESENSFTHRIEPKPMIRRSGYQRPKSISEVSSNMRRSIKNKDS